MKKPRIFIGSSSEGLEVARAIQEQLYPDAEVVLWNERVFSLSVSYLDSLLKSIPKFDFALFVLRGDDCATVREQNTFLTRGNVIFEMGMFFASLGKSRTFAVYDSSSQSQIISDLDGISVAHFDGNRELVSAVGMACSRIRASVKELGTRTKKRSLLAVFSNPSDCHRLRCDIEMRTISSALQTTPVIDGIEIKSEWAVQANDLDKILFKHRPEILHIACSTSGEDLLFDNEMGNSQLVNQESMLAFLQPISSDLDCVLLSACNTDWLAHSLSEAIYCAVGMPGIISDEAAIAFTSGFYTAIGQQSDYTAAYHSGIAKMRLQDSASETPVMYLGKRRVEDESRKRSNSEPKKRSVNRCTS